MANYIVWAGNRRTPFEKYEDAAEYAKRINERNKYRATILKKDIADGCSVTWQEIQY